jgi:hypothetical protein
MYRGVSQYVSNKKTFREGIPEKKHISRIWQIGLASHCQIRKVSRFTWLWPVAQCNWVFKTTWDTDCAVSQGVRPPNLALQARYCHLLQIVAEETWPSIYEVSDYGLLFRNLGDIEIDGKQCHSFPIFPRPWLPPEFAIIKQWFVLYRCLCNGCPSHWPTVHAKRFVNGLEQLLYRASIHWRRRNIVKYQECSESN